jgi:uncharacterized protein (TIGR02246 family)
MTNEDRSLDDRIRRLDDREEIRQLAVSYKLALDGKDTAGYAALFARDGVLWCTPELVATGPAAIKQLVDDMSGNLLTETVGTDLHAIANHLIELDGDRATGSLTWLYYVIGDDGGPQLSKVGHYVDEYVREDGVWRFARREAPTDIPVG